MSDRPIPPMPPEGASPSGSFSQPVPPVPSIQHQSVPGAGPGQKPLEDLVLELQTGGSDAQWQAAEALGNLGDPRAVEPLIGALSVQHWRVRCSAAQALGRLRDPRAVNTLIAVFNQSLIDM